MFKLFENKKLTAILCVVLAVVLVASGILVVMQLTKNDTPSTNDDGTYTVSFVTNGGKEIEAREVEKGTVLAQTELPVPSKRGDMFLAWYTDEALTTPYWDAPVESDMTLYASYVQPVDNTTVNELVETVIPYADVDFSVTVRSTIELTEENLGEHVALTVNYGAHEDGTAIGLSLAAEGDGIWRISGNFAQGGDYIIKLLSDAVTFNEEDAVMVAYGLTDALRTLRFRVIGESRLEGELSDMVADIPSNEIVVVDSDSVTVSGADRGLVGASEEENGVICIGEGDDIADYYKVVGVEAASDGGITYNVRPALVEEVYDQVSGYQWEDLDADDFVLTDEMMAEIEASLQNNEDLNNYVEYLALATTYTPTYAEMSMNEFGEVVATPVVSFVTPQQIEIGFERPVFNEHFVNVLGEETAGKFVKLELGITYAIKLAKLGGVGSFTAEVTLDVDFWIFAGAGGHFELGWHEYDMEFGMSVMTQTDVTFSISLISSDSRHRVNINDEIEAIYNSIEEPTPENLLEQYNELMGGGSKPIELFNRKIFEISPISLLGGAVKVSAPIRFVLSLEVEATFSSHITVLTGSDFGFKGDTDSGLDAFHYKMRERFLYRLELRGHIELRAGAEIDIEVALGYGLLSVSMGVQTGVYAEIFGYFFYEVDGLNYNGWRVKNSGGAFYFSFGAYIDLRLRAEFCTIAYTGSLYDKKWEIIGAGDKEIVYGFAHPTSDVILLQATDNYCLNGTGVFDLYVYDITQPRSESNPKIVKDYPYTKEDFEISFDNDDFAYIDDENIIWCRANTYRGVAFEAKMTIKFKGAQMNFRRVLTKYVDVKYIGIDEVELDKVGTTCKVDFTIDGVVIFTREYQYGEELSFNKQAITLYNGGLTEDEQQAVFDAGYEHVDWLMGGMPQYVTEDLTFEATHTVYWVNGVKYNTPRKRTWTVTFVDNGVETVVKTGHKQEVEFPHPTVDFYNTEDYQYTFEGWKAEDGTIYAAGESHPIVSNLKLTPYYSELPRWCTITFDTGIGGTYSGGLKTVTYEVGYGYTPQPSDPIAQNSDRVRYTFIGWSPELGPATEDMTYVAQWKKTEYYAVTFDAGVGQFDESGTKTFTVMIEKGKTLEAGDFPANPYKKGSGGFYAFDAWSSAVSAGTVINGDVTYTANYKNELTRQVGITVSDGVITEDIAAYLDGTNRVKGYTYTPNTEYQGNSLQITKSGLTVSGEASNIHITVQSAEVTLQNLTLIQSNETEVILVNGKSTLNISGTVRLTNNTMGEGIRGGDDADIILKGVNAQSKLKVNGQLYGIAVYGKLSIKDLSVEITMPRDFYHYSDGSPSVFKTALQVQDSNHTYLTVQNSDIVINNGVVTVPGLKMTGSNLSFTAKEFKPDYSSGLEIMSWYELTAPKALIDLTNSDISFAHGIAISFAVTVDYGAEDDILDDTIYYINTNEGVLGALTAYSSQSAFLSDVATNGYSGMVEMDGNSSIE